MFSPIRNVLQFLRYGTRENVGNNEVCVIGILEYHVMLVNRVQIRRDVSHWANAGSLNNTGSNRQELRSAASGLGLVMTISQEVHNPVIDIIFNWKFSNFFRLE